MEDRERNQELARRAFELGVHAQAEGRSKSGTSWVIPVAVSLIISASGLAATWGVNAQRLSNLEQFQKDTKKDLSTMQSAREQDHTQLAVVGEQYTEIIKRLDGIDRKLDDADGARKVR